MAICGVCGSDNAENHTFCSNCGEGLSRACPSCGTNNDPDHNFCFNCGQSFSDPTSGIVGESSPDGSAEASELRLVSVLFVDLVGFTAFSEGRDPEEVRGLLTRYYVSCKEIISRYGGITDKFIGDAVMGVFGAVEAHEDDAERATRAALELVDMVAGLGAEVAVPEMAARAGVMSGQASVGSGGNEQGLVVGDLVNTASRLQSLASPGRVLVGESTRDMVGSAIEFRPVGESTVKGKEMPVSAHQAVRVLALSTARSRAEPADGPFVGRDDELRILKDQLHATGRDGRARMVSVIGEGGIGKTRLAIELVRYIDGITEGIYYHRGRSPAYGEGVTFWALGEMIRQRTGISEGEDPTKSRMKLRSAVAEFAPSDEDQRWMEPRLAAVIGLAPAPAGDRAEQFAALRTFFQAIADRGTVLMVFEDLQWADPGLLDFIEELVERTTAHPILVLGLARPELLERRPEWATGQKHAMSMHLGRLDSDSMHVLVSGLAPALPEPIVDQIAERSAGVPLFAVEFVRMLFNTGQLVRDGAQLRFSGSDDTMAVPDTVNAIIGARLDKLEPAALSVIQDASVLGLTFTTSALAELRGYRRDELDPVLRELTRRDMLELDENPRSPERGQYRFVQDLIREVAYSRLSRSERVTRHLAAARMFDARDEPELAGVVSSHYADAVEADPGNAELIHSARVAIGEAALRASDLGSDAQAAYLYEQAAQMGVEGAARSDLELEAAKCLIKTSREDRAVVLAKAVMERSRLSGDLVREARAATVLANAYSVNFDAGRAVEIIVPIYERTPITRDPDWIHLAVETSRALMLSDHPDEAIEVTDAAIPILEELEMIEELLDALINKGSALGYAGRPVEGAALLEGVAEIAGERDLLVGKMRALNNLAASSSYDKVSDLEAGLQLDELIKRVGSEAWLVRNDFFAAQGFADHGRIDEALARLDAGEEFDLSEFWADSYQIARLGIVALRDGWDEERWQRYHDLNDKYIDTNDPQLSSGVVSGKAGTYLTSGRHEEALALATSVSGLMPSYPFESEVGLFAAALLGQADTVGEIVDDLEEQFPRGRACRGLAGIGRSFRAGLDGDLDIADTEFARADTVWEAVVAPMTLAFARAVFAVVVGPDDVLGVEKASQARAFFEEHDIRLHLDGIMRQIPDPKSTDVAV